MTCKLVCSYHIKNDAVQTHITETMLGAFKTSYTVQQFSYNSNRKDEQFIFSVKGYSIVSGPSVIKEYGNIVSRTWKQVYVVLPAKTTFMYFDDEAEQFMLFDQTSHDEIFFKEPFKRYSLKAHESKSMKLPDPLPNPIPEVIPNTCGHTFCNCP